MNQPGQSDGHAHGDSTEWAEALARTVAHLAAQLTIVQLRLRALGGVLVERGLADDPEVATRLREIAATDTGAYLRENLGDALVDVIDVDALERDLTTFLTTTDTD